MDPASKQQESQRKEYLLKIKKRDEIPWTYNEYGRLGKPQQTIKKAAKGSRCWAMHLQKLLRYVSIFLCLSCPPYML